MHELIAHARGRRDTVVDLLSEVLHPRGGLFGARALLEPLVQLADLNVHIPDQLVDTIGFHDGAVDNVLLAVECSGLLIDVLGQCIERCELRLGFLAQLLELREPSELVFHFLDRFDGRG